MRCSNQFAKIGVDRLHMYRSNLETRDKGGAVVGVVAVHVVLLLMLLQISGRIDVTDPQKAIRIFDVTEPDAPPPEPLVERQEQSERPREQEGAASPENIRSQATPVVAPRPEISLPVPVPVETSETPNEGAEPTQGASDQAGPGTGAGGVGTGTGSGGSGSGTGGGGGGGIAVPASLLRGITNRDYPAEIQRRWPHGGRIFVRVRVEPNGRASQCDVMRGYGDRVADDWTCRLVMERATFRPARNARGEPISAWYGYIQAETRR